MKSINNGLNGHNGFKRFLPPFALGFLALSFQIFFLREFSAFFYGNEITFGLLLGSWLLWGGLGSLAASKFRNNQRYFSGFYYIAVLVFPICLLCLRLSRFILNILPGEISGTLSILAFSLILSFFVSFPLGCLFVFNTRFFEGNISHVYLLESLGSTAAGLTVYFILIPLFSNWEAVSLVGAAACLSVLFSIGRKIQTSLILFILIFLGVFFVSDFFTQQLYWKPFTLVQSKDSPYGKLHVLKTAEQISLYNNNLPVYSYPDLETSEETVHFALLQNPRAKDVLLIGGGAGGSLEQVLKYPQTEIDYVEIDPDIIRLSRQHLPVRESSFLENIRVHLFFQDGKTFLVKTSKKYDMIIMNLSDPATSQINRFYTREFFSLVRSKLEEKGVFSFRVSSAENYISSPLQDYLASLYFTLRTEFPEVAMAPGSTNIFLASDTSLSLDHETLSSRIQDLDLQNIYISPSFLFSRLDPLRIETLENTVKKGNKVINQDLKPISYFFNSILWSSQFKGLEAKIFSFFRKVNTFWLLDLPLILALILFILIGLKRKRTTLFLAPVVVMGLTTVIVEIIVIIAFQSHFGHLYQKIALLLTCFMAGLFAGSFLGKNRVKNFQTMLFLQAGFIFLLFCLHFLMGRQPPEFFFFLFLFILGFLGGYLFVVANALYLQERTNYGIGYGLDLLGSFLGALAASSILIPLTGLKTLLMYIILLNSFCLLFLFWGNPSLRGQPTPPLQ
jgi:spermidine synthase